MMVAIGVLVVLTLVVGGILAATPWLMPATECFGVSIPHGARDEEPIRGYMRSYALVIGVVSVLSALAWPLVLVGGHVDLATSEGPKMFAALATCTMLAPCVASMALMLHYRNLVRARKQQMGWQASASRAAAYVGWEDLPQPLPFVTNLAYVLIAVVMAAFAITNYDALPDRIPMNVDITGAVAVYASKTPGTALFPAYLTLYLGAVFMLCHFGILHSKRPVDPHAPRSSAMAYAQFARAQSAVLTFGGMLLSVAIGVSFYMSAFGVLPLQLCAVIMTVGVVLGFVVPMIVVTARYGQSGARAVARSGAQRDAQPAAAGVGEAPVPFVDDDEHWPLGFLYRNAQDPSVFVPKRFGVGWTINVANPMSWVLMAALVLATIALCWGSGLLALS